MSTILVFPSRSTPSHAKLAAAYRSVTQAPASARPSARPLVGSLPFFHTGLLATWWARWRMRSVLRNELLLQPDSVLEDAGFERGQAEREAARPFWMA